MSRRIGAPLTEIVAKPRVLPKTLPMPEPVPEKVPEKVKEKVPVEVGAPVENAIHYVASFLGVSDAWVATKILSIAGRIEQVLNAGGTRGRRHAQSQS